ncbi:MAG: UDP-N-acetylmuramoyl-L-alanyl-D-glutamate--2,6-diaminopimelate ligase, partial [Deltaproteobacteria bacterium]|nr:UDP-N-acetylmuramoyl-L-alanyl-D-glutamate--2,6-diaminopimelate ligase [Deltaproteobacteria bacterium]
ALAAMAAAFYNHPALEMVMIGITGTNGKTTTTYLLEAVIKESGGNPGVIGTINYRFNGQEFPASFTTPEPVLLQGLLQKMAAAGVTHVIMEASSHALAQKRLAGLEFDIALFTNLTRDHLDFHGSMDAYYQAKKGLFRQLKGSGYAVVLVESAGREDSSWGGRLLTELRPIRQNVSTNGSIISCGFDAALDVSAGQISYGISGTTAELDVMGQRLSLRSGLAGEFNLKNIIGAVGVAVALHLDLERVKMGLLNGGQPPGRLERIGAAMAVDGQEGRPEVFVDYAHTPDALENVLRTLKNLGNARLLVVFGCGGDRDKGKRYLMGRLAGQLADTIIITADNSRSESTALIMAEIERGVKSAGHGRYFSIVNRAQAIAKAIGLAGAGDVVLIAGKGHEDYQISRAGRAAFSDRLEAEKQLGVEKQHGMPVD